MLAGDDDGAVGGCFGEGCQVVRVAGHDPVAWAGQQDGGGVDRVAGAGDSRSASATQPPSTCSPLPATRSAHDPLRGQRAAVVRAAAIASKPVAGLPGRRRRAAGETRTGGTSTNVREAAEAYADGKDAPTEGSPACW